MSQAISPIIQPDELLMLRQNSPFILIDVRTGPDAVDRYIAEHLAGALHLDLELQLADKKSGRSSWRTASVAGAS